LTEPYFSFFHFFFFYLIEAVEKPLFLNLPHSIFVPIIQMGLDVFMGAPLIFFLFPFFGGLGSVFHSYPLEIDSLR